MGRDQCYWFIWTNVYSNGDIYGDGYSNSDGHSNGNGHTDGDSYTIVGQINTPTGDSALIPAWILSQGAKAFIGT